MTLLRVLLKGTTVPPPSSNVRIVKDEEPTEDVQILEALDPDNPYNWAVHGL